MISTYDSADQAIEKTIKTLCKKLSDTSPGNENFMQLVEAISKLRASQNVTVIESSK